ncbi:MAG: hypothetical protein JW894_04270 [Bacteroidales bacterium]|nr:hypothetical protein [Bacteroidales bacterium]
MDTEKGNTVKLLKEKRKVSTEAKEKLKEFTRTKKAIMNALNGEDLTIAQLSEKLSLPYNEVVYYLMSLLKFGLVQVGEIDDMDEYFTYKVVK